LAKEFSIHIFSPIKGFLIAVVRILEKSQVKCFDLIIKLYKAGAESFHFLSREKLFPAVQGLQVKVKHLLGIRVVQGLMRHISIIQERSSPFDNYLLTRHFIQVFSIELVEYVASQHDHQPYQSSYYHIIQFRSSFCLKDQNALNSSLERSDIS